MYITSTYKTDCMIRVLPICENTNITSTYKADCMIRVLPICENTNITSTYKADCMLRVLQPIVRILISRVLTKLTV